MVRGTTGTPGPVRARATPAQSRTGPVRDCPWCTHTKVKWTLPIRPRLNPVRDLSGHAQLHPMVDHADFAQYCPASSRTGFIRACPASSHGRPFQLCPVLPSFIPYGICPGTPSFIPWYLRIFHLRYIAGAQPGHPVEIPWNSHNATFRIQEVENSRDFSCSPENIQ